MFFFYNHVLVFVLYLQYNQSVHACSTSTPVEPACGIETRPLLAQDFRAGPLHSVNVITLECFFQHVGFSQIHKKGWHQDGKCCSPTAVCPWRTLTLTTHILPPHEDLCIAVCLPSTSGFFSISLSLCFSFFCPLGSL